MDVPAVILHKNRDKALKNRHPWIFSGAVGYLPEFEDGAILPVHNADGELFGYAYFNRRSSIIGRMLSFGATPPLEAVERNFLEALALRRTFLAPSTDAYRVVNGEGDGIPGLVIDLYGDTAVVQISTLGMDKLKPVILDLLTRTVAPRSIYEKSNLPSRREEGLPPHEGLLAGEPPRPVEIHEDGLRFKVDIVESQKTGFYLDQREMRRLVRSLAGGRRVLNAFAYTGGFSVFALAGGAARVDSVDTSEKAIELAGKNCRLNGFGEERSGLITADVFEFVRRDALDYDFVILDPPSFAKRKAEVVKACRGYKDIHRVVLEKIAARSLVLTFSCSFFVSEDLFRQVIFQAAREAGRNVRILQRHHQAPDHPVSIYHPESDYMKGFLLYVE